MEVPAPYIWRRLELVPSPFTQARSTTCSAALLRTFREPCLALALPKRRRKESATLMLIITSSVKHTLVRVRDVKVRHAFRQTQRGRLGAGSSGSRDEEAPTLPNVSRSCKRTAFLHYAAPLNGVFSDNNQPELHSFVIESVFSITSPDAPSFCLRSHSATVRTSLRCATPSKCKRLFATICFHKLLGLSIHIDVLHSGFGRATHPSSALHRVRLNSAIHCWCCPVFSSTSGVIFSFRVSDGIPGADMARRAAALY